MIQPRLSLTHYSVATKPSQLIHQQPGQKTLHIDIRTHSNQSSDILHPELDRARVPAFTEGHIIISVPGIS